MNEMKAKDSQELVSFVCWVCCRHRQRVIVMQNYVFNKFLLLLLRPSQDVFLLPLIP